MKSINTLILAYLGKDPLDAVNAYADAAAVSDHGQNASILQTPRALFDGEISYGNIEFLNKYAALAEYPQNADEAQKLLDGFDTVISDASNADLNDYCFLGKSRHYFLMDFVPASKKKIIVSREISDAAVMPDNYRSEREYCLNNIDFSIDADYNIISTKKQMWLDIAEKSEVKSDIEDTLPNGFVFSYITNAGENKIRSVAALTRNSKLSVQSVILDEIPEDSMEMLQMIDTENTEDIICLISSSKYVVTDSLNAAALAIVLEKPFTYLYDKNDYGFNNARSFLEKINLSDRMISVEYSSADKLILPNVSYNYLKKYIKENFGLSSALEQEIKNKPKFDHWEMLTSPIKTIKLIDFKIQNIILPVEKWQKEHCDLLYRGNMCSYDDRQKVWEFSIGDNAEFFTYLNSLSIRKWKRFTNAKGFKLHLTVMGKLSFHFFGHYMVTPLDRSKTEFEPLEDTIAKINKFGGNTIGFIYRAVDDAAIKKEEYDTVTLEYTEPTEIVFDIPEGDASVLGFHMSFHTDGKIYDGYYSALMFEDQLNDVDISICTTTYKKEDFIINNIKLIKNEIIDNPKTGGLEDLSDHLYMNVVDNGRSEKVAQYNSLRIAVHENANVGGAGGFTRGMLETLKLRDSGKFNASHVLFMDDDVVVLPESIKRTYALLRTMNDDYKKHFISGAMLKLDEMNIQHEDAGFMTKYVNLCHPQKPTMNMSLWDCVLKNEENFTQKDTYAAWWFCCVPMSYIRYDNLSLPLFFRGDDIEFSLRNKAKNISMNGIAIWHMRFGGKYNPATDMYLAFRNFLFTQAVSGINQELDFMKKIKKHFFMELRKFNYISCDLLLDAIEDFMKGPDFFADSNSERVQKAHMRKAKEEKFLPYNAYSDLNIDFNDAYRAEALNDMDEKIFEDTVNGHTLPDFMLRTDPYIPAVGFDWFESPGKQFLRTRILAVNPHNKIAVLREMDKEKFTCIMERYKELMARYERESEELIASYRASAARLRSAEFWEDYLERSIREEDEEKNK